LQLFRHKKAVNLRVNRFCYFNLHVILNVDMQCVFCRYNSEYDRSCTLLSFHLVATSYSNRKLVVYRLKTVDNGSKFLVGHFI